MNRGVGELNKRESMVKKQDSRTDRDDQEFEDLMDLVLEIRDKRRREEHTNSNSEEPMRVHLSGTIVSIPVNHFHHSLRLLEDVPFDLKTFFELTAYLELGVLFDRLAIVPDTRLEKDCFKDMGPTSNLFKKDILVYLGGPDVTDISDESINRRIIDSIPRTSVVSRRVDYREYFKNALARRQMAATSGYHVPFEILNPYLDVSLYEQNIRAYSLLLAAYEQLSSSLRKEIGDWERYLAAKVLFVPPIMTLILRRCSSPKDIPQVFLDVRGEFEPLRRHFREYQARLRAHSSSVGESLKAISDLESAIRSLSSKYGDGSNFVLSEWQDGLALLPDVDSLEQVDTGIVKFFLGKPMKWIAARVKNRKFLPLFNLRRDFYRTRNYPTLVQKVFRTTISQRYVKDAYDINKAFRRLVPHRRRSPNNAMDSDEK